MKRELPIELIQLSLGPVAQLAVNAYAYRPLNVNMNRTLRPAMYVGGACQRLTNG